MNNSETKKLLFERVSRREPTVEEFEAEMAPLREALRREVLKTEVPLYEELTIRKMNEFWKKASGGRDWDCPLEQLEYKYDIDSPKDVLGWCNRISHFCDLLYASITFYPECLNLHEAYQREGKGSKWVLYLMGHPGDPYFLALYTQRLLQAGVHFVLRDAKNVLKAFNRYVAGRKISIRAQERAKKGNDPE